VDLGSTMTVEQLTALEQSINAITSQVQEFRAAVEFLPFENLKKLSFDAAAGLIAAAGGLETLGANLASYYANFYSAEEQRAQTIANINAATIGTGLDAATATRETFRALVEAQDVTTASGQQTYAALLAVSGAFAELVPAATMAGAAVIEVVKLSETLIRLNETTTGLRIELLTAQGDTQGAADALRTLNTFGFSESEIAAYDLNDALRESISSTNALAQAQKDNAAAAIAAAAEALVAAQNAAAETLAAAQSAVSEAMAGVSRAVDAERKRITDIYKTQADAINVSLSTVGDSIGQLQSLSSTLKSTLDGMRISGSPASYRTIAQADIAAALRQARSGGGLPLAGELDSALRTVAQPSEQLFSSFEDYARDFYKTANDISSLADLTEVALTADQVQQRQMQDQLAALERYNTAEMLRLDSIISTAQAQIDAVNGVNTSVLSVSAAIANLGVAITALASAQAASRAVAGGGGGGQTSPIVGGSDTGIGDSGYSLVGNTLYFPGGGSHSVAGAGGAQTLMDTYGLTSGSNGSLVRTRAMGGYTPPGMTWVGEQGPELANFQSPSMIYTAAQSRALSSGGNNAEIVAELRALRVEVAGLRQEASAQRTAAEATAVHTNKTAQLIDRAMPKGNAIRVEVTTA
jgi:hypothetical protein